ncbi:nucleopolyhedrovirus P10 family protein [Streptomyces sp. SID5910]|uniref:nucleopolyhedrovirus P10 family protein n=1 Tax=Streptomyces sp. SID5910 TaxID=2690312 RepID=UPI00136EF35C|nr:nucleopolyhedrovirus P10 family protein [Streptomyces sp. SID5910]MYR42211.1 nucleopolyhedrovirus P10 family protein [Streptomyces sp. SID5910]
MTTPDRWTRTVREQLGLGRLLPLGGPRDGAWVAERAARDALLAAARNVPGVRPGRLRIALAAPQETSEPVVPAPPSALPPGALRVTADFAASAAEPLPASAARLRTALTEAATRRIGLTVTEVDLRATELLDAPPERQEAPEAGSEPGPVTVPEPGPGKAALDAPAGEGAADDTDEGRAAGAALTVPGVRELTRTLGRPVTITKRDPGQEAALPHRHVRVELAVDADRTTAEVARQVRAAVAESLPDHPTVAVLVTAID